MASANVGAQGTTFSFQDAGRTYTLSLRHNPYNVAWNYNVNTNIVDTYVGQVVQLLSINIDQITIEGQLGREGAYGKKILPDGSLADRNSDEHFDFNGPYPGLHGMTEFFRSYFAIQSQGADSQVSGHFTQIPMSVHYNLSDLESPYSGSTPRHWPKIIPTSFPSFARSWDNYAPMWRVQAWVVEADKSVTQSQKMAALERLQNGVGYRVVNPFIDNNASQTQILGEVTTLLNGFEKLLPAYSPSQLQELAWNTVSGPASAYQSTASIASEFFGNGKNNP